MKKILITTIGLLASFGVSAKIMNVGLIDQDRPPYFIKSTSSNAASGMYIDILDEIGKLTGIQFRYNFLPQSRIRAYMKLGILDVEPGIDPSWRVEDGEEAFSVYSDALFSSQEVIVYNPNRFKTPPSPNYLIDNYQPCNVLGFSQIANEEDYTKPHDLVSESQVLALIKLDRCDWAMFPINVIESSSMRHSIAHTEPVATYELRLRFNVNNSGLISDVNKAISTMKSNGRLYDIMNSYIED